jgi:Cytochrome P460
MNKVIFLTAALSLGVLGCTSQNPRVVTRLNDGAALTGDLPANPFQWKVITSAINKQDSTMYTLFGNDTAVKYVRTSSQHNYPAGAVLALVTWNQQEDPRWFGGNIPSAPKSVEFVTVGATPDNKPTYTYQSFEGTPLKQTSTQDGLAPDSRAAYLVAQRSAVMP